MAGESCFSSETLSLQLEQYFRWHWQYPCCCWPPAPSYGEGRTYPAAGEGQSDKHTHNYALHWWTSFFLLSSSSSSPLPYSPLLLILLCVVSLLPLWLQGSVWQGPVREPSCIRRSKATGSIGANVKGSLMLPAMSFLCEMLNGCFLERREGVVLIHWLWTNIPLDN